MKNCLPLVSVLTTNEFVVILLVLEIIFMYSVFELIKTKKFIKKSNSDREKRKITYEKLLEELADTRQIFQYFTESDEKLPDNLHNIMLACSLNNDYYAVYYLRSLKLPKKIRYKSW